MSVSEKAIAIKQLVSFCVELIPKIVDVIVEIISLVKEVKANG